MNIAVTTTLDVEKRYLSLAQASLGEDSIYIRNKETLEEMFQNSEIDKNTRGELLGRLLEQNTSIAQAAMSTAINWEAQEVELALKKVELENRLDLIAAQEDAQRAEIKARDVSRNLDEARIIREYGTATYLDGKLVTLGSNGKIWEEQQLVEENTKNATAQGKVIVAQEQDVYAKTHQVVANTYTNFGMFDGYTIKADGITGAGKISTNVTLSDTQQKVAAETAKGYAWNTWSNSATSTASMIGVQISSGNVTGLTDADIDRWRSSIDKMNAVVAATI